MEMHEGEEGELTRRAISLCVDGLLRSCEGMPYR